MFLLKELSLRYLSIFCLFSFFLFWCSTDSEEDDGEPGNGMAQWRLSEQLFPCPVCGKVFGRQQTLSRHLSLHTGERACWGGGGVLSSSVEALAAATALPKSVNKSY